MAKEEKRMKQRLSASIPVKIKGEGRVFSTETIDISPSGAYCRTTHPMPLLSKVAVALVVSVSVNGRRTDKTIDCRGTIVRTHPVIVDGKTIGYDVAIFFNELGEEDRNLISEYINQSSSKEE